MEEINIDENAEQAFHRIAEAAEKLLPLLLEDEQKQVQNSIDLLKRKVIPLIHHECPLLVAVTGGGSVGKSTLFNMLAGGEFSGVKSKAGYTKRTLAAIRPSVARNQDRMKLLFELFKKNATPVPLKSSNEMLEKGAPLYVESKNISENMAVLDTPDFDTGDKDAFANRDAAEEILAASDVLIYLFTNQTYNNKANTDFVRNAISGIGRRKVILVYRCSAAFSDEEVWEHMDEVLRNLFPDSADPRSEVLGLYRVDESDAVVNGTAAPTIHPFSGGKDIMSLINGLDIVEARKDNLISQCKDIIREMKNALNKALLSRCELVAYRDSVKALASRAVLDSLKNFPQRQLMEQFIDCWKESQPRGLRAIRCIGERVSSCAKWLHDKIRPKADNGKKTETEDFEKTFHEDFLDCIGKLRVELSQPALEVKVSSKTEDVNGLRNSIKTLKLHYPERYTFSECGKDSVVCLVSRPAVLALKLNDTLKLITDANKNNWTKQASVIACSNQDLIGDIKALVDEARREMDWRAVTREWLKGTMVTLPTVGAAAFVFCTSGPLGGLFGATDLLGLVALPASSLLDEEHKKSLEKQLTSLYNAWFKKRCKPIYDLIDENITSHCTSLCDDLLGKTEAPFDRLQEAIDEVGMGKECIA